MKYDAKVYKNRRSKKSQRKENKISLQKAGYFCDNERSRDAWT